ncbi:hypothetical protein BpHYR1_035322 [Brachionus plicatilis]|uniref:Uncharacterized protein n=1 Tax=Brachionus plicatilis TaxID=10195 RepID=A0A3M7RHR1_BRAPC|nr:hypothetical protein BpHYR1_035322 [Brachionus plicatilis]
MLKTNNNNFERFEKNNFSKCFVKNTIVCLNCLRLIKGQTIQAICGSSKLKTSIKDNMNFRKIMLNS